MLDKVQPILRRGSWAGTPFTRFCGYKVIRNGRIVATFQTRDKEADLRDAKMWVETHKVKHQTL